jgi:hypothetical protein
MPDRFRIKLDEDVEGHMRFKRDDLTGQDATVRLEDGTEVEGHVYVGKDPDDTEGHGGTVWEIEMDDTYGDLLRAATDRGDPIHIRFDGADVEGHWFKR